MPAGGDDEPPGPKPRRSAMIVTNAQILSAPPSSQSKPARQSNASLTRSMHHQVLVSRLTDQGIERLRMLVEGLAKHLVEAPTWKVVYVDGQNGAYWRRAPGAIKLENALGLQFFKLFGALLDVGLQAYADSQRSDLGGSQKLGRASIALLLSLNPILALAFLGAKLVFPSATDRITADIFTDRDPLVQGLSNLIVSVGGKRFQQWSSKPSWIDFF
jgi:hypothetical protein